MFIKVKRKDVFILINTDTISHIIMRVGNKTRIYLKPGHQYMTSIGEFTNYVDVEPLSDDIELLLNGER